MHPLPTPDSIAYSSVDVGSQERHFSFGNPLLLALTFVLSLGAAMSAPAWQAIVPELVPCPELPTAVALRGNAIALGSAAIG
jgi:MFS family permease